MFLFYVLSFFKKGDTIQVRDEGRTLFKEIRYMTAAILMNMLKVNESKEFTFSNNFNPFVQYQAVGSLA